jgi:hypothetical protein
MSDISDDAIYPPQNLPVLYLEGIHNISVTENVVKMYVFRDNPAVSGQSLNSRRQPVMQIIMPIDEFLRTVIFLERVLSNFQDNNVVSRQKVDELRNLQQEGSV